jgi:hypothetical protein
MRASVHVPGREVADESSFRRCCVLRFYLVSRRSSGAGEQSHSAHPADSNRVDDRSRRPPIRCPQTDRGFVGPLGAALSPDGSQLLAASSGAARIESADLFDLSAQRRSDYVPYDGYLGQSAFYGVAFAPNGTQAWASGGGQNVVHTYTVAAGHLQPGNDITVPNFPAGLAYGHTPVGDRLYVANNLAAPAATTSILPGIRSR